MKTLGTVFCWDCIILSPYHYKDLNGKGCEKCGTILEVRTKYINGSSENNGGTAQNE